MKALSHDDNCGEGIGVVRGGGEAGAGLWGVAREREVWPFVAQAAAAAA